MKKIMFNEPYGLQQATFDGSKTMTRRVVPEKTLEKWYEFEEFYRMTAPTDIPCYIEPMEDFLIRHAPYKVGEIVAVAQRYSDVFTDAYHIGLYGRTAGWTNKMFVEAELMPHHIEILGIKVEGLADISSDDCMREGIREIDTPVSVAYTNGVMSFAKPYDAFKDLIDRINKRGFFESNPLVYAYEYKRID